MTRQRYAGGRIAAVVAGLIVTLIATAVIAFGGTATEEAERITGFRIVSKNIEIGDELRIAYKVMDDTGLEGVEPVMLFWDTAPEKYTRDGAAFVSEPLSDEVAAAIGAADCDSVFLSPGIPQTSMTQYLYCSVYAELDGKVYVSEPMRYSVLDYVYQRRAEHAEGIRVATEDQLALYTATLRAGAAAQNYLDRYTDRLASAAYATVTVNGGALSDGFSKGAFHYWRSCQSYST